MKKMLALLLAFATILGMTACNSNSGPGDADPAATTPPASADPSGDKASAEANEGSGLAYIEGTNNLLAGKPYDGTTLTLMISSPGDAQYENLKLLTESEFTPLTGITVNWDMGAYAELYAKEVTEVMAGTSNYQLLAVNDTWGPGLRNYMLPLDEYIARDNIDLNDWGDAVVEVGRMGGTDGTIYGLPFRGHYMSMYYRTDIYEELDLEIPTTWDQLIENCKIIQEKTDLDGLSVPYGVGGEQNLMPWYCFMYSMGADFFDENWHPVFNSAEGLAAFEKYVGLLRDEKIVSTDNITLTEGDSSLRMGQGKCAHFMGWSWIQQKFINPEITNPELVGKISCFKVPSFDGVNDATNTCTMWTMGIPANCENPDAAWEYIKWLCSADTEYKVLSDKSQYDTVIATHNTTLLRDDIVEISHGAMTYGYESLSSAKLPPLFDDWMPISEILEIAMNNAANGADCKTELDAAAAKAEKILSDAGYF